MHRHYLRNGGLIGLTLLAVGTWTGCVVPQPRGAGRMDRFVEPTTHRTYYLYLPKTYVQMPEAERRTHTWPTVVSFHGMQPFDTASAQCREWQQEADRYGYVVVAPVLNAFSVFGEFPLRSLNNTFRGDETAVLAILRQVFATTQASPKYVLSTSWSSGGYMAHYMLNRHPDVFSALAVRQSDFSSSVLDAGATTKSVDHPVMIQRTEHDFAICEKEAKEAIQWYERHGYKNFAWVLIRGLGHSRTPDTAAAFFAKVSGAQPNTPPTVLATRQAIDGNATGLSLLRGELGSLQPAAAAAAADNTRTPTPNRNPRVAATHGDDAATRDPRTDATPPRMAGNRAANPGPAIGINVSSAVGFEPLLLVYSADCPSDWQWTADFVWSLDGAPISRGVNGQKTLAQAGDYTLELRITTQAGVAYRTTRQIRVLKNIETRATTQH